MKSVVRRDLEVSKWILSGKRDSGAGEGEGERRGKRKEEGERKKKEKEERNEMMNIFADMTMEFLNARLEEFSEVSCPTMQKQRINLRLLGAPPQTPGASLPQVWRWGPPGRGSALWQE